MAAELFSQRQWCHLLLVSFICSLRELARHRSGLSISVDNIPVEPKYAEGSFHVQTTSWHCVAQQSVNHLIKNHSMFFKILGSTGDSYVKIWKVCHLQNHILYGENQFMCLSYLSCSMCTIQPKGILNLKRPVWWHCCMLSDNDTTFQLIVSTWENDLIFPTSKVPALPSADIFVSRGNYSNAVNYTC